MSPYVARLGHLTFYGIALAASGWFLVASLTNGAAQIKAQRSLALENVTAELETALGSAFAFVEVLQLTAEN